MKFLSGVDAVTTIGFHDWAGLTDRDRQRLIHHELDHLEVGDHNQLLMRTHDFEDFNDTLRGYGLASETGRFSSDSLQELFGDSSQFDMLDRTG